MAFLCSLSPTHAPFCGTFCRAVCPPPPHTSPLSRLPCGLILILSPGARCAPSALPTDRRPKRRHTLSARECPAAHTCHRNASASAFALGGGCTDPLSRNHRQPLWQGRVFCLISDAKVLVFDLSAAPLEAVATSTAGTNRAMDADLRRSSGAQWDMFRGTRPPLQPRTACSAMTYHRCVRTHAVVHSDSCQFLSIVSTATQLP